MSTIPPTSPAAASRNEGAPGSSPANGLLGQNDFLKLMIAQLQAQDPLQPANTNEYLSELAQFTQVEQITNLANASELSGATQLIGRTVSYSNPAVGVVSGVVQSVQSNAQGTTVTVEGTPGIALSSLTEIR